MNTLLILLLALASGTFGERIKTKWDYLDISDPIGQMRNVDPVGFEPANTDGHLGGGDSPVYLCASKNKAQQFQPGKLIYRANGDFVCYLIKDEREIGFQYNWQNHKQIFVLTNPPECYSWIPYDSSEGQPTNWVGEGELIGPICRVSRLTTELNFIVPGYLDDSKKCIYAFYGYGIPGNTKYETEILVWNEYAFTNFDLCSAS